LVEIGAITGKKDKRRSWRIIYCKKNVFGGRIN
jgi:hypothetical protein